jgi:hypothetical protein
MEWLMQTTRAAKFSNRLSLLVVGLVAGFLAIPSATAQEKILTSLQIIEWVEENRSDLEDLLSDRDAASAFLVALYGDDPVLPNVGEHLFIDLDGDNGLELVATIDYSGRGFYASVAVVYQNGHRLDYQELGGHGGNITNLRNSIADFDGDGDLEIAVPRLLEPYQGAAPIPIFIDVYHWNDWRYTLADPIRYEDFYRNRLLPRIEENLGALSVDSASLGADMRAALIHKYKVERTEIINALQ